ncbi:hypothetical protein ACLQ3C_00100 [Gordonia sp. DT30]|uniref:hypothetical protein n=1 Tax=Gordonia sp. DT30 TaxID=3416546 RepID=UPI003CE8144E
MPGASYASSESSKARSLPSLVRTYRPAAVIVGVGEESGSTPSKITVDHEVDPSSIRAKCSASDLLYR